MHRYLAISVVLLSLFSTACQTSVVVRFSKVKPGMEKDDVLDLMGSPQWTQRFHGKDRWVYILYDDRTRLEKEVHFSEGNAIYIGDSWKPDADRSAVVMDNANELKNKQIDEQIVRDVEQHRRSYEEYEAQAKGYDKVRYVPQFEPIR